MKKIGNVILNYEFFNEDDIYSDGDSEEEELLEICKSGKVDEALKNSSKWTILYHLSDIRGNIVEWYPFEPSASVLEVGSGCGAITGTLCKKLKRVVSVDLSERRSLINAYRNSEYDNLEIVIGNFKKIQINEKFDYVTLIGVLEYSGLYIGGETPYVDMLKKVKQYLKPNGKIIIAIENKMGLKYLNGAYEDHVGIPFLGIEDYRGVGGIRTFSKPELESIIKESGIMHMQFYYPVPDYKLPATVYSDSLLPQIGDIRIWGENYDSFRFALYNEGIAYDQVCKDGMFEYFSNSFVVVCGDDSQQVPYVHYTVNRKKEYQIKTTIKDTKVEKKYIYSCPRKVDILADMVNNYAVLQQEFDNVKYLKPEYDGVTFSYDFIEGEKLDKVILKDIHNKNKVISYLRKVVKEYLKCNEEMLCDFKVTPEYRNVFNENYVKTQEKSLKISNADMTLHNFIIDNAGEVYCIDYEWIFSFPIPFEYIVFRMLNDFWGNYGMYLTKYMSKKQMMVEVGIKEENIIIYEKMENSFAEYVYGKNRSEDCLSRYKKGNATISIRR